MNRNREIIQTSLAGIAANILLAGFKFVIGAAANSVSIRADALNNTTDALSSLITIIGTKLSEKSPTGNIRSATGGSSILPPC